MLRFYLGSAWGNREQVRLVAAMFQAAGWKWIYDWTQHTEADDPKKIAIAEVGAIKRADIVFILLPGDRGTHFELGAAVAAGKPVVLWAENVEQLWKDGRYCPYYDHPNIMLFAGWPLEVMVDHWTKPKICP